MKLPRTLRDAVQVTRELGIRYLWIDALCILQGSDEQARNDCKKESSRMESVYANAHITIVAAASSHCDGGLFYPSSCALPFHRNDGIGQHIEVIDGLVNVTLTAKIRKFTDEPINSRAWTLQERVLSPRTLTYALQETFWQCDHHLFSDMHLSGVDSGGGHAIFSYRLPKSTIKPDWQLLVTNYCSRSLTNLEDKLPAIAGLARKCHMVTGDRYLAGLWESTLLTELLWVRYEHFNIYYGNAKNVTPTFYRAPSWSWASIDGIISFINAGSMKVSDSLLTVLNCALQYANPEDPFGMVLAGHLTVRGPLKQASRLYWAGGQGGEGSVPAIFVNSEQVRAKRETQLGTVWLDSENTFGMQKAKDAGENIHSIMPLCCFRCEIGPAAMRELACPFRRSRKNWRGSRTRSNK